ncbi:MAG: hypothetical protein AAFX76_06750, partial [Planctomycetota bacterium]
SVGSMQIFYYDLNTQTLFADDASRLPPFDNGGGTYAYPDGTFGSAVRADVYACEEGADIRPGMTRQEVEAAGGYIAALYRYTTQQKQVLERMKDGEPLDDAQYIDFENLLISDVNGTFWVPQYSTEGDQVMATLSQNCGQPRYLRP